MEASPQILTSCRGITSDELIYLSSPYSGDEDDRYMLACEAAGKLMLAGYTVFSPIAHNHTIARVSCVPMDYAYWKRYSHIMLSHCALMAVLTLPNWEDSVGVSGEIDDARSVGLPIAYLDPDFEITADPNADVDAEVGHANQ